MPFLRYNKGERICILLYQGAMRKRMYRINKPRTGRTVGADCIFLIREDFNEDTAFFQGAA